MKRIVLVVALTALGVATTHAQQTPDLDPDRDPSRDPSIMSPKVPPARKLPTVEIIRTMKPQLDDTCVPCKERWWEQDKRGPRPW
jgi:hypothetical protein